MYFCKLIVIIFVIFLIFNITLKNTIFLLKKLNYSYLYMYFLLFNLNTIFKKNLNKLYVIFSIIFVNEIELILKL